MWSPSLPRSARKVACTWPLTMWKTPCGNGCLTTLSQPGNRATTGRADYPGTQGLSPAGNGASGPETGKCPDHTRWQAMLVDFGAAGSPVLKKPANLPPTIGGAAYSAELFLGEPGTWQSDQYARRGCLSAVNRAPALPHRCAPIRTRKQLQALTYRPARAWHEDLPPWLDHPGPGHQDAVVATRRYRNCSMNSGTQANGADTILERQPVRFWRASQPCFCWRYATLAGGSWIWLGPFLARPAKTRPYARQRVARRHSGNAIKTHNYMFYIIIKKLARGLLSVTPSREQPWDTHSHCHGADYTNSLLYQHRR